MVHKAAQAPGRGRYDRTLSASERARRRRELLVDAARTALVAGESLALEGLLKRSGLGRNTFYGHFENVESLQAEVVQLALEHLSEPRWRPDDSATPFSAVRSFVDQWLARLDADHAQARVALFVARAPLTLRLTEDLLVLAELGRRAGVFGAGDVDLRASCLAAALVQASALAVQSDDELRHTQPVIEDLVLRVLR